VTADTPSAPTVRARVAVPGGARRAHLRELRRESLWFWPAIAAIAAWVGGDLAARDLQTFTLHQGLFPTNLDDARTLLATIAAALLTFTGVVFSITLVALQMASTQYSPRVLRTFVRKPVTKLALATFIATFVYSLTLLARVGTSGGAHTVPQGAVGLAYLLVMVSVIVFVFFVHSTVRSMRVTYVVDAVFRETLPSVMNTFSDSASYVDVQAPPPDLAVTERIGFDHADAVLDGLATHHLVQLAAAHGCVLRLTVPVGTFLPRGFEIVDVLGHSSTPPGASEILRAMNHSAVRTIYQDPNYGVRQLVDIAIRALSAAINDPTTAVQSLDRIHGVLRAVATRPDPSGYYVDAEGSVRLIVPVPGWDRLVELAFTEVALYGSMAPQVTRKLTAIFDDLAACVPPERVAAIDAQRAWLRGEVGRRHTLPTDRVLTPDPLGLG
jgi:uncharacterized membrane protein